MRARAHPARRGRRGQSNSEAEAMMRERDFFVLDVFKVGIARTNRSFVHEGANGHYCSTLGRRKVIG
jgi:hypothetical protein